MRPASRAWTTLAPDNTGWLFSIRSNGRRGLERGPGPGEYAGSMYDELAEGNVPEIWAGVDIGKTHHH